MPHSCNDLPQKYNRQYDTLSRFQAHNGRVLASAFTFDNGKPCYVTGGSDCSVAVWNVKDCIVAGTSEKRTSNGQIAH